MMCCLMYEHDTYVEARRRFPREGKTLRTTRGSERVVGLDIFTETIVLKDAEGNRRSVKLDELKRDTLDASRTED